MGCHFKVFKQKLALCTILLDFGSIPADIHLVSVLCSDCKAFKDKIEEITESLSNESGESAEADAAADLIGKLSVEGKDKEEEKTEAKEEPAPKEEKKDETE